MVYTTEKMMKDVEEKKIAITDDEKKNVEEGIKYVKDVKDKDDIEAIKKASEALSKSAQAVGMKMYQQEQKDKTAPGGQTSNAEPKDDEKKDDKPIEGEVVKE